MLFILIFLVENVLAANFGDKCIYDGDCLKGLKCKIEDKLFQAQRICQCQNDLEYIEGKCIEKEEIAEILTILVPVLASVLVTILLAIACCCWIYSSTLKVELEMKQKVTKEEFELEIPEIPEDSPKPQPKVKENVIKISENGQKVPQIRPEETILDLGYQSNMRQLLQRDHS